MFEQTFGKYAENETKTSTRHCLESNVTVVSFGKVNSPVDSAWVEKDSKTSIIFGFQIGVGDVVAQWLVRRTWDLKVKSLSPGWCTHIVFLGKTLNSHSASLHPGV